MSPADGVLSPQGCVGKFKLINALFVDELGKHTCQPLLSALTKC